MANLTKNAVRLLSLVLLTGITIALLIGSRPETKAELQPPIPSRVKVGEVTRMDIQPVTRITGKLQPVQRASLRFEVAGNVVKRNVEPGQSVERNEVLLQIDAGDFIDTVAEAKARLALEQNAVQRDRELLALIQKKKALQQREVDRMEQLGQKSLASKSNFDNSLTQLLQLEEDEARLKHSVATAKSRQMSFETSLSMAERNLERSQLRAPFAGTVNRVNLEVGDYVASGQIALELVKLDELDVSLETTGEVAKPLRLGQTIDVFVDKKRYSGTVIAIAPDPNTVTNTHALRIRVSGDELFAGELAEVVLPGKPLENVDVVPISAVLQEEGRAYLFSIKDSHLVRRPITLLARQNDLQVIDGVSSGMPIVTQDVAALADGQEVTIE